MKCHTSSLLPPINRLFILLKPKIYQNIYYNPQINILIIMYCVLNNIIYSYKMVSLHSIQNYWWFSLKKTFFIYLFI